MFKPMSEPNACEMSGCYGLVDFESSLPIMGETLRNTPETLHSLLSLIKSLVTRCNQRRHHDDGLSKF